MRPNVADTDTYVSPTEPFSNDDDINRNDGVEVTQRVRNLARSLDRGTCRLVLLIPAFDRHKGWYHEGHKGCVAWLNAECGMSPSAARDRKRVAYALENLPVITRLFELGELSWSKVRALTRIATTDNERQLASDALHMSASAIEQLVSQYRDASTSEQVNHEDAQSKNQYKARSVSYRFDQRGMLRLHAILPPLEGMAVLKSMARAEDVLFNDTKSSVNNSTDSAIRSLWQLRADALCMMAETYLGAQSEAVRAADRYQVVVHVDAATMHQTTDNPDPQCGCRADNPKSSLKCHIENGPRLAASTVRRLTSDCSLVPLAMKDGEPVSIGRKSRVWPASIVRAILARDQHCQYPGCTGSRFLHIHHRVHWVDGGETSVEGGVALCNFHHRLIHERRYLVEKTLPDDSGQLPTRTVQITDKDGESIELESTEPRFKFRRPDGSYL